METSVFNFTSRQEVKKAKSAHGPETQKAIEARAETQKIINEHLEPVRFRKKLHQQLGIGKA